MVTGYSITSNIMLNDNAGYIFLNSGVLKSEELKVLYKENIDDANNLDAVNWTSQRKKMRHKQYRSSKQQSY